MTIFSIFLISFALASDAFMVTVSYALTQKLTFKDRLKISGFFGLFQSKMTVLGWSFCLIFPSAIAPYDHFIAFILLSCIGLNMIQHGKSPKGNKPFSLGFFSLSLMALATSIDAFATGISLSLMNYPIFLTSIMIGIITFILCYMSAYLGSKLKGFISKESRLYYLSGATLIAMGIKILLDVLS